MITPCMPPQLMFKEGHVLCVKVAKEIEGTTGAVDGAAVESDEGVSAKVAFVAECVFVVADRTEFTEKVFVAVPAGDVEAVCPSECESRFINM